MTVKIKNAAFGTLAGNISAVQTLISLAAGQGARFPALTPGDWFWGTIVNAANVAEVVKVTVVAGDTFTVLRGQDGTTAAAFNAGDRFELRAPAALWNDFLDKATFEAMILSIFGRIITMWSGSITELPARWSLCDGTNGTPDLRNKFVVGAGSGVAPSTYAVGATGGSASTTLAIANLPVHAHGVTDPGHTHVVNDPTHVHGVNDGGHNHFVNDPWHNHGLPQTPHGHGVNDPGHAHGVSDPGHSHGVFYNGGGNPIKGFSGPASGGNAASSTTASGTGIGIFGSGTGVSIQAQYANIGINAAPTGVFLSASGTGVSVQAHATGVFLSASGTGITTQNVGSGTAYENRPPYYALAYIMYTGIPA